MTDDEAIAAILDRYREKIAIFGHTFIGVFADEGNPSFVYTAGLTEQGLPEFVMYGLPIASAMTIIEDAIALAKDGSDLSDGTQNADLASLPLIFREVTDFSDFKIAKQIAGTEKIRAVQIVWPDTEGRFPWSPDFTEEMRAAQPLRCGNTAPAE